MPESMMGLVTILGPLLLAAALAYALMRRRGRNAPTSHIPDRAPPPAETRPR